MKSRLLAVLALFLFAGASHAGWLGKIRTQGRDQDSYASLAVNKASNTVAVTLPGQAVISSTPSVGVATIVVNSSGTSSFFEFFDTKVSTSFLAPNMPYKRIAKINTGDVKTVGTYTYNVFLASGLAINNQGNPPADITVNFSDGR